MEEIYRHKRSLSDVGVLPTVTVNMLTDFLKDYHILHCPSDTYRDFSSIIPLSKRDPRALDDVSDMIHTLFICHSDNAEVVLGSHPGLFVLALTRDESIPGWISSHSDRVLLVQGQENFSYFSFLLQKYFIEIMVWENDMDRVVLRGGSITELLNSASHLTDNFLSVNDSHFNLIAYSDRIAPPDPVSKHLLDVGCLPERSMDRWKERIMRQQVMIEDASDEIPFTQIHRPLYVNYSYFASIVMVCSGTAYTKGLEDIFTKIANRARTLCEAYWQKNIKTSFPHYFFFMRLLSGEEMSKDYVRAQSALAKIPDPAEFKLVSLETGEINKTRQLDNIAEAAALLNNGRCHCFPYRKHLLVLYYSEPSDSNLSHLKSNEQLIKYIYEPFGISSGVSQVFEHIEDLDMAYRQTSLALGMKHTIMNEIFAVGEEQRKGVFLFEELLLTYLVSDQNGDARFRKFTFDHTLIKKLYDEDKKNNTNYVALFWFYLHHERNASLVAKRLHMHRNTVLYHIEKLQKRFDMDLSVQSAFERMRIDYKAFFLESSSETFEDVFRSPHEEASEEQVTVGRF